MLAVLVWLSLVVEDTLSPFSAKVRPHVSANDWASCDSPTMTKKQSHDRLRFAGAAGNGVSRGAGRLVPAPLPRYGCGGPAGGGPPRPCGPPLAPPNGA